MPTNVTPIKSPSQTPPRVMTRDDRRVIIAEVKGCYDENNKRYMDGWHDERVAVTLGAHVPVGWVKEVREDYFGEDASNEQFDAFMKQAEAANDEFAQLKKTQAECAEKLAAVQTTLDGLNVLAKAVRRAVGK